VRTVPRLCEFCPGIFLITEEKARKYISQGKENLSHVKKNLCQNRVYILPKTPTHYKTLTNTHITKSTHTHTRAHTHTLQNNIKTQHYKLKQNAYWKSNIMGRKNNQISRVIQIMTLQMMQFLHPKCRFLPPRPNTVLSSPILLS
jgi:hypothetical protein